MTQKHTNASHQPRAGERGAALITSLLVSTLLLLAGGALLVKTAGSTAIAFGSTAEMQAYYSAEAGLQSALNVLRGNVQNGAGDLATFREAVDKDGGTLDAWLDYDKAINGTQAKTLGSCAYSVLVTDPDATAAGETPKRLLVTSTGYGPRGARKQVEMLLRTTGAIDVPGGVTLRGTSDGGLGNLFFDLGTSAKRKFLTEDAAKPVFVTTQDGDETTVNDFIENDKVAAAGDPEKVVYDDPRVGNTEAGTAELPEFLTDPALTEQLIEDIMAEDTDDDNITVIDGDGDAPKDGEGILLCTGTLGFGGNTTWRGIILVLGEGHVEWKGEGTMTGAMFLAKYDRTKLDKYDAVTLDVRGAGTSTITYSPDAVNDALRQLGFRVLGVQEK